MGWLSLLSVVLCLVQVVTCQSPAPESCVHYSYPQLSNCLSFTNCTGAVCNITHPSGHASFVVHKCQDPVTVDLTVVTQNSNFQRQFDHSETVAPDYWDSVHVMMSRNTTHLVFDVTAIFEGDIAVVLIPNVAVFLDPRACMCQSLQSVALDAHLPSYVPAQFDCTSNSNCSGVHCLISQSSGMEYTSDATIDPCTEGLQVTVHNTQGQLVYQRSFQDSQQVPFSFRGINATLHIEIVHYNYSMDLEMYLEIALFTGLPVQRVEMLPRHNVILDRSHCTNMTTWTSPHPTSSPSTSHTSTPHTSTLHTSTPHTSTLHTSTPHSMLPTSSSPTSHQGLTLESCVRYSYPQWANCLSFTNCTGAVCNITHPSGHASFVVHKCQDPVTVDLTVVTQNSNFQRQFDHSETVVPDYWDTVRITMSRNTTHLLFEVTAIFEGDIATFLIPEVAVFLDPRECMCQSLQSLALDAHLPSYVPAQQDNCTSNSNCSGVHCLIPSGSVWYTGDAMIEPCTEMLQVTVRNAQGQVVYQRSFQDSQQVPFSFVGINATLHVEIVHYNYSMDLEMYLDIVLLAGASGPQGVEVFPHRKVILDRSHCTNLPTWPSPTLATTHQGLSSNLLTVAIATPVGVALCLGVLVLVVVIVVLAWRHRRRSGQYEFHRMAFSDVKEEET